MDFFPFAYTNYSVTMMRIHKNGSITTYRQLPNGEVIKVITRPNGCSSQRKVPQMAFLESPTAAPWASPAAAPWASPAAAPWASPAVAPWASPAAASRASRVAIAKAGSAAEKAQRLAENYQASPGAIAKAGSVAEKAQRLAEQTQAYPRTSPVAIAQAGSAAAATFTQPFSRTHARVLAARPWYPKGKGPAPAAPVPVPPITISATPVAPASMLEVYCRGIEADLKRIPIIALLCGLSAIFRTEFDALIAEVNQIKTMNEVMHVREKLDGLRMRNGISQEEMERYMMNFKCIENLLMEQMAFGMLDL